MELKLHHKPIGIHQRNMFMYMYVHVNLTTRNGASYVGSPSSFLYISLYLRLRGRSRWTQHAANTVVQLGRRVVQKITGKESPTKPFGEFWWFVNVYLMVVCCSLPRYFAFQLWFGCQSRYFVFGKGRFRFGGPLENKGQDCHVDRYIKIWGCTCNRL